MRAHTRIGVAAFAAVTLLLVAGTANAQAEWIYLARGTEYAVIDPESGERVGGGTLAPESIGSDTNAIGAAGSTPVIVPTPGGRYVFFFFAEADIAIAVDAETHDVVRAISLPSGSERIQFSSMGDMLYVEGADGRVSLSHRRGEVSGEPEPAPDLEGGRIAFNRRATRVYGERDDRLVYALARDGSEVATVRLRGSPYHWQVSPNFRYLLGTRQDGSGMALVDESRARVIGYLDEPFLKQSVSFDEGSREVRFLSEEGDRVITADVRRFRAMPAGQTVVKLSSAFLDGDDVWHGLSQDGGALIVDATGSARRLPVDVFFVGHNETTVALVTLKPGQGFACF